MLRWLDQHISRNAELVVQSADHLDRQAALVAQHFCHPPPRADERLQSFTGDALLLHPEPNRLDRIGGAIGKWFAS